MFYTCCKNFDNKRFKEELQKQLQILNHFFKVTLDQFASLKQKLIRNDNQSFMTKIFRKTILKRSKSRSKFNEERSIENWSEYMRQHNFCSNLRQSKKHHFNNLKMKYVTENKQFWKTIKLFLTEKTKTTNNIILTENNQRVREDKTICQIINFCKYYQGSQVSTGRLISIF